MKSKYEKFSTVIKLVYDIKDKKNITILHPDFIKKNKNNCKMIINNKIYLLTDTYKVDEENMKILKIKLLILNTKKINLSYMFYECEFLKEFHLISEEEEISKHEYKNENVKYKDDFDNSNNQLNITFLSSYDNITNIFNEAIKIYNDYNEFEKMNNIISLSDVFLSSSKSSIKSKNYNFIEYSSFYENSFFFKFIFLSFILINIHYFYFP